VSLYAASIIAVTAAPTKLSYGVVKKRHRYLAVHFGSTIAGHKTSLAHRYLCLLYTKMRLMSAGSSSIAEMGAFKGSG
jgi:hypothetical protein